MIIPTISITSTYDIQTVPNKMTVIGIHTPNMLNVQQLYPGLLMQFKHLKMLSCDVNMASASMLPVDPAGIGFEEGQIAPDDIFNPVLFRAMSNESFSLLESRIFNIAESVPMPPLNPPLKGSGAVVENDLTTNFVDEHNIYYSLLSTKKFRTAMPQSGLSMRGLKPLVYQKFYNFGANGFDFPQNDEVSLPDLGSSGIQTGLSSYDVRAFRGSARPMPWINTTYFGSDVYSTGFSEQVGNKQSGVPFIPKTMVACLILPPARMVSMFFRMSVTWRIAFKGLRSSLDFTTFAGLNQIGLDSYFTNYTFPTNTAKALQESDCVDVLDGTVTKIMES